MRITRTTKIISVKTKKARTMEEGSNKDRKKEINK